MRKELDIGGKHKAAFDEGVMDIVYDGEVDEHCARRMMELGLVWSTGNNTVWCSDVSNLKGYSAAARKVMSTPAPGTTASTTESTSHLFVSGASLKTKALLALVMTATRLLGKIRYQTTYFDTHEEALEQARRRFKELERAGLARLPDAAK